MAGILKPAASRQNPALDAMPYFLGSSACDLRASACMSKAKSQRFGNASRDRRAFFRFDAQGALPLFEAPGHQTAASFD